MCWKIYYQLYQQVYFKTILNFKDHPRIASFAEIVNRSIKNNALKMKED